MIYTLLRKYAAAAIVALAFAATPVAAQEFQVPVDDTFVEGDIRFTGQLGTVYFFEWKLIARGDRLAVCGIGYVRDSRLRETVRGMARGGQITVDGRDYPVDLSFFSRARTRNALSSGTANCRVTQAPLPRSGGVNMRFGSGTFRN